MAVPEVGKFVISIVMSAGKIIEIWQQNKDINSIVHIINDYENALEEEMCKIEGILTQKYTVSLILSTCKNNIVAIWSQFCEEIQQDYTNEQIDSFVEELKTDILSELKVMNTLNGKLATQILQDYYNKYDK
jgi:hypothetical protein